KRTHPPRCERTVQSRVRTPRTRANGSDSHSCRRLTIIHNSLTFIHLTPSLRVIHELLDWTIVRLLQEHKNNGSWTARRGGSGGNRTHDQWIKSPVLYRLSYRPTNHRLPRAGAH